MRRIHAGDTFTAQADGLPTGLTGTLGVSIVASDSTVIRARSTGAVHEVVAGSGLYAAGVTAPVTAGDTWSIVWDAPAGTVLATEELETYLGTGWTGTGGTPSAADVRLWAESGDPAKPRVNFAALGYPTPTGSSDPLDSRVALAVAYVQQITGRIPIAAVPTELLPLAQEAVLLATVQFVLKGSGKAIIKGAGALLDGIKSFRAGDYNQVNRDLDETRKAGLINPWAELADLLMLLATPERREELIAELSGQPAPAMFTRSAPGWAGYSYGSDFTGGL